MLRAKCTIYRLRWRSKCVAVCAPTPKESAFTIASSKLRNTLLAFYAAFGDTDAAQRVRGDGAEGAAQTDGVALNNLMRAYIASEHCEEALALFEGDGALTDDVSRLSAIEACAALQNFERGCDIYAAVAGQCGVEVHNAMIAFHGRFGRVDAAQEIFERVRRAQCESVVTVNSMLTVCVDHERAVDALALCEEYASDSKSRLILD